MGEVIDTAIGVYRKRIVAAEKARVLLACLEHAPEQVGLEADEDIIDDLVVGGEIKEIATGEYLTTWEGRQYLLDYIDGPVDVEG